MEGDLPGELYQGSQVEYSPGPLVLLAVLYRSTLPPFCCIKLTKISINYSRFLCAGTEGTACVSSRHCAKLEQSKIDRLTYNARGAAMTQNTPITVAYGDGIGPEIMEATL